ncbi:HlyD family efflux transporter periplasmic adaptor subunit [Hydrogenimonas sp. SS33]|uniref:HlyD family secretion protein n=1 Tax=Hydrogenimonas leucolamina TaxID=2954236 RepID=UPI00336C2073
MNLLKKYWLGAVAAVLLAVAGWMIYQKLHPKTLPANLVEGVGRIDGDLVNLNVKYPGRVVMVRVDDGDPVRAGELVARQKDDGQEARRNRIAAEVAAKERELASKKTELAIARKTIPLALKRAHAALDSRQAQKGELERDIAALEQVVAQDERDARRSENLYEKRLIQKEALEKARLKLSTDREKLAALKEKRKQVDAAIAAAKADLEEATASQRKIEALTQGIEALENGLSAAKAALKQADSVLADMNISSPVTGHVVERIAQPGEVLGAGMPVATLIDPHSLYLKIFVDTIENGKIKLHDKAVIFLDARPDRPIPAEVVRIAQKAEFTPKEVNVRSDRIQRVYAVHLKPLKPDPLLKLGIPAVGVISLDGKGLPRSLHDIPEI